MKGLSLLSVGVGGAASALHFPFCRPFVSFGPSRGGESETMMAVRTTRGEDWKRSSSSRLRHLPTPFFGRDLFNDKRVGTWA